MRKLAVSLADSIDLRVILSVLYIITEVMREELRNIEHSEYKENVEAFKEDLGMLSHLYDMSRMTNIKSENQDTKVSMRMNIFSIVNPYGEELLIVKLLSMVTCFCSGSAPHFPMKKVLLLLWKLILVSLGGIDILRDLKKQYREEADLDTQQEDTIEVARTMRASSPPMSAADLLETQNQKRNNRPFRRVTSINLELLIIVSIIHIYKY